MTTASPYAGQRLCLTSLHGKEQALARPFALGLGASLVVSRCDTDALGTFSGEVARLGDALSTCRRKALLGLKQSGLRLGLASEASFGPHPAVPLVPVGHELLLFIDLDRDLTVVERRIDWRTNYAQKRLDPGEDPAPWVRQIGFPSHGLLVRPAAASAGPWHKDLTSAAALAEALATCRAVDPRGQVWLETDMRAHRNPTRMRAIRRLGVALARRLRTPCPSCASPGFGWVASEPGLPCGSCGSPTALAAAELWGCPSCAHRDRRRRRDGLAAADPGQCSWCNP